MPNKNKVFVINNLPSFEYTDYVDEKGNFIKNAKVKEALLKSHHANKDLVCFNSPLKNKNAFCKIIDYGKWKYQQKKKNKKEHNKHSVKEIRFSPLIGDHDIEHKIKHVKEFLNNGDEVILSMRLKGTQKRHASLNEERMDEIVGMCREYGEEKKRSITDSQIVVRMIKKQKNRKVAL